MCRLETRAAAPSSARPSDAVGVILVRHALYRRLTE